MGRSLGWIVPIAVAGLLVLLYFTWPAYREVIDRGREVLATGEQERVAEWVRSYGAAGPLVVCAFAIAQTIVAIIPSALIMIASVVAYGPFLGGLLAFGASMLAAAVAYGIGRAFGPVTVERLTGSDGSGLREWVESYGFWGVVAGRISPLVSTDGLSVAAGLLRMGARRFFAATAVGLAPATILMAWLGKDFERLKTGLVWIGVLSVLAFVAWVVHDRTGHWVPPRLTRRMRGGGSDRRT